MSEVINMPEEGKTLYQLLIEWEDYATEVDGEYFLRYSGGITELDDDEEEVMILYNALF